MRLVVSVLLAMTLFVAGCKKNQNNQPEKGCDIQKTYTENAAKVTITNGIWGTIAFTEGDCMPRIQPSISTCKTCPVKRTLRIYEYTTFNQITLNTNPHFIDTITTPLIKELETDDNGFFQTDLAPGNYSVLVLENGKLYLFGSDGQRGISPVNFTGGQQNVNLTLTYKAVF